MYDGHYCTKNLYFFLPWPEKKKKYFRVIVVFFNYIVD